MSCKAQHNLPAATLIHETREQFARRLSAGVRRECIDAKMKRRALKAFDFYEKHGGGRVVFKVEREYIPADLIVIDGEFYMRPEGFRDNVTLYEEAY